MRSFTIALALCTGALALSACGGETEKTEEAAAPAAAAPTGAAPTPKAGLWENTTAMEGQPARTVKICLGENTKDMLSAMGAPEEDVCSERKVEPTPGGYAMKMTCNFEGQGVMKTEGKITGDMASAYTAETTTTITAGEKTQTAKMTYSAKYLGACPEGMGPGAMDIGNMIIDPSAMKK